MANVRFKGFYCERCSTLSRTRGRIPSFFLSVTSAGSVAALAIRGTYPIVWATIVGVAQLLQIAKPYMPFIGAEKEILGMSCEFEKLCLLYEPLWYDEETRQISDTKTQSLVSQYREREIEQSSKIRCPEIRSLPSKAQDDTERALAISFPGSGNGQW